LSRYLYSVELTENGIAIRTWAVRLVPWQHIDAITQVSMLGDRGIKIHDAARDMAPAMWMRVAPDPTVDPYAPPKGVAGSGAPGSDLRCLHGCTTT
jgi:hypothetical protein